MKRLISTMTAGAAAAIALASVSPALAQYNGQGNAGAGNQNGANGQLPASGGTGPSSPVIPLGTAAVGVLLIGAGGVALTRRRGLSR